MICQVCDFKQIEIDYNEHPLLFKLFLFKSGAEVVEGEVVGAEVVGVEVSWLKKHKYIMTFF